MIYHHTLQHWIKRLTDLSVYRPVFIIGAGGPGGYTGADKTILTDLGGAGKIIGADEVAGMTRQNTWRKIIYIANTPEVTLFGLTSGAQCTILNASFV